MMMFFKTFWLVICCEYVRFVIPVGDKRVVRLIFLNVVKAAADSGKDKLSFIDPPGTPT